MKNEYIIINKSQIEKRIEELKESLATSEAHNDKIRASIETFEIKQLEWCLSQSTPLIPEIEKAFDAGRTVNNYKGEWKETYSDDMTSAKYEESKDYISNLKLDI